MVVLYRRSVDLAVMPTWIVVFVAAFRVLAAAVEPDYDKGEKLYTLSQSVAWCKAGFACWSMCECHDASNHALKAWLCNFLTRRITFKRDIYAAAILSVCRSVHHIVIMAKLIDMVFGKQVALGLHILNNCNGRGGLGSATQGTFPVTLSQTSCQLCRCFFVTPQVLSSQCDRRKMLITLSARLRLQNLTA